MSELAQIIYTSLACPGTSEQTVQSILFQSRKNNPSYEITGMLLLHRGNYFQIIEGLESNLSSLIELIEKDSRHSQVVKIIEENIPKRAFKNWSMGFATLSEDTFSELEGMNDYFQEGNCLAEIDQGRAKKMLKAFSQGVWHRELR